MSLKDILTLVVLAWLTYDSFGHTVGDRWQDDSKHASATPHMDHDYESTASIVHAFTQDSDSSMDDLDVSQKIFKMQCMDDCRAAEYSGMHSQPAVMKLVHHLTKAKQILTEMQHVRGGNFSVWMERSGIDSIMRDCHNLISTILNESASIPVNESDYTNQNQNHQTGHPSASHSQQVDAGVSDPIESPPSHLPPESARRAAMFETAGIVTSKFVKLEPYTHSIADVDAYIKGLPSAGVYLVKVNGTLPYTYTGQFRDGLPHGRGMAVSQIGECYEGYFLKGKLNHHGRYINLIGHVYEGEWKNGEFHGKGKKTYSGLLYGGDVYEGEWQHDKRRGKGKMTFSGGDVYEGEWHDDKKHGKGKMKRKDGSVVTGTWIDGQYDG